MTTSRRKFLGGGAVAVSLPFLPSLMAWSRRAHAATCATPPRRFMAWYVPNGMHMPDWTPTTTGTGWKAPLLLEPLEPVRKKVLVVTGLENQSVALKPPPNDHAGGTGCFLTQMRVNGNLDNPNRTSLDQHIANLIGSCTNLPSLQLGTESNATGGNCDGANCAFSRGIAWTKNTPLPNITRPALAFDRLFQGFDKNASAADAGRRRALRTSVLDHVVEDARLLSMQLASADRRKLDEFTTGVRELETRIGKAQATVACNGGPRPAETVPYPMHVGLMVDLMAMAFQCDITRVATFMINNSQSGRDFGFIGAGGGHHAISHHMGRAAEHEKLKKIGRWQIEQAAALLVKLDAMKEADGRSVLDHTCFFLSSECADGDRHNHWDLPVLMAGGLGGTLRADGRHVSYTQMTFPRPLVGPQSDKHMADLFLTILRAFGGTATSFGDNGTKILQDLVA